MANFKFDVDADGIALITWDMPGKSMNVIDFALVDEVEALVEKVARSEEHTSELQSQSNLVCRLLLEKKNRSRYVAQPKLAARHVRWQIVSPPGCASCARGSGPVHTSRPCLRHPTQPPPAPPALSVV